MSGIGPELPPHLLAKRKRREEEEIADEAVATSGAKREKTLNEPEKRRRVIGPAMPPALMEQRPSQPPNDLINSENNNDGDEDDGDDDGFGPALPTVRSENERDDRDSTDTANSKIVSTTVEKPKRDEWMMLPPKQDDLAARLDPNRPRPRGFNTAKGARGAKGASGDDDASAWHETTEQKQKRLADEMMGVAKPAAIGPSKPVAHQSLSSREAEEAAKLREQVEKSRGPSLMDRHKTQKGGVVEEDDPSKRAFDREKDMAVGKHVGQRQRQEMLKKASGYSSKFSGGGYL